MQIKNAWQWFFPYSVFSNTHVTFQIEYLQTDFFRIKYKFRNSQRFYFYKPANTLE